jgi:hypothetical protein
MPMYQSVAVGMRALPSTLVILTLAHGLPARHLYTLGQQVRASHRAAASHLHAALSTGEMGETTRSAVPTAIGSLSVAAIVK